MIQRIQTVYLLLGSLFLFATALPFAAIIRLSSEPQVPEGATVPILQDQVYHLTEDALYVWVFLGISALLGIAALVLYRQRKKQLNLAFYALSLSLFTLLGMSWWKPFLEYRLMEEPAPGITPGWGLALWIAALLAYFLAIKAIKKDHQLIRSMDRLR